MATLTVRNPDDTIARALRLRAAEHGRSAEGESWLDGIEGAFHHFGGLPGELLLDNANALVKYHDQVTREVEFNSRLHAFARYWDVRPVACAPYRARTTDKIEQPLSHPFCYFRMPTDDRAAQSGV